MPGGKASAAKLNLLERRRMAVELRKQGGTYRQIAAQLSKKEGVSPNYNETDAYRDVTAALKAMNEQMLENAAELRRLELERLDELFASYFQRAKSADYAAFDRLMAIMNQRGKYVPLFVPAEQKITQTVDQTVEVNGSVETADAGRIYQALALALAELQASANDGSTPEDGAGVASLTGATDASVPEQS